MRLLITTTRNFLRHHDTDLAAGLTYYAVLSVFPAALALVSVLALVGDPSQTIKTVNDILAPLISSGRLHDLQPTLHKIATADGATVTFAIGLAGALYSASSYVGAFSRAMNVVQEVEEDRPFWKLRPIMLLITLISVVLCGAAIVIITVSGPVTTSVGNEIGVGKSAQDIWEIAKWPGLAVVLLIVLAILFHATPNSNRSKLRFLTPGALLALVLWVVASAGFAFYVANFSSYNKTYGSVAGVIVGLLWLWLTNVAMMFGAEYDAARDQRIEELEEQAPRLEAAAELERANALGMFPHTPGEPVYGPQEQPVPQED
ncbi:MAG TPA: YihY/virulence factor BrkB family protein [Marmoricola sp.]|jgi:membrane protein|nr:YihY/virulence factor BrkB family protein [Marmoricola sp.]